MLDHSCSSWEGPCFQQLLHIVTNQTMTYNTTKRHMMHGIISARKQDCDDLLSYAAQKAQPPELRPPHLTTLATIDSASAAEPTPSLAATSAREMRE
jgi:hypothetical protein